MTAAGIGVLGPLVVVLLRRVVGAIPVHGLPIAGTLAGLVVAGVCRGFAIPGLCDVSFEMAAALGAAGTAVHEIRVGRYPVDG